MNTKPSADMMTHAIFHSPTSGYRNAFSKFATENRPSYAEYCNQDTSTDELSFFINKLGSIHLPAEYSCHHVVSHLIITNKAASNVQALTSPLTKHCNVSLSWRGTAGRIFSTYNCCLKQVHVAQIDNTYIHKMSHRSSEQHTGVLWGNYILYQWDLQVMHTHEGANMTINFNR